jgi:hypothetical protein
MANIPALQFIHYLKLFIDKQVPPYQDAILRITWFADYFIFVIHINDALTI